MSMMVVNGFVMIVVGGVNIIIVWDKIKGVNLVYVVVIDIGLLVNYEDFVGVNICLGYDFISNNVYNGMFDFFSYNIVLMGFVENDLFDMLVGCDSNLLDLGDWVSIMDIINFLIYCGLILCNSSWYGIFVMG